MYKAVPVLHIDVRMTTGRASAQGTTVDSPSSAHMLTPGRTQSQCFSGSHLYVSAPENDDLMDSTPTEHPAKHEGSTSSSSDEYTPPP